jgi:PKD repeat protein
MRGWLAVALVSALLLSGCAAKSTSSPSSTPAAATSASSQANTTSAPPAATRVNHAPTASLAAKAGNGTSALNVTFRLSGHDVDGDALNWTLAFGDHGANATGAALPANVTHAYAKAGRFNVTLTVTDGHNTTVAHLALSLTAGNATAIPDVFTGHVAGPDAVENTEGECLFALVAGTGPVPGGVAGDHFALVNAKAGWKFSFSVAGMVAQFQNAGSYVGGKAASGTVPAGATSVLACSDSAVNTDYTLTIAP